MSDPTRPYTMLPKATNLLRLVNYNIVMNLRYGNDAMVTVPPLLQRAYMLVNETGVIPYQNYPADITLVPRQ